MKKNFAIALGMFFAVSMTLSAQTGQSGGSSTQGVTMRVDGNALVQVTGSGVDGAIGPDVKLTLAGAATAGADPTKVLGHNVGTRLKMSSLTAGTAKNKITAGITNGSMANTNTELYLRLLPPTTSSAEAFMNYGTAANGLKFGTSEITDPTFLLSGFNITSGTVTLVDGIGTAWSGTADDNGYVIEYNYKATGGGAPVGADVVVTFTIAAM